MLVSFKRNSDNKNYSSYGSQRNHVWYIITSLIPVFFILLFSPSSSVGFSPESNMETILLPTTKDNQKNEEQEYRLILVDQIPAQGDRPVMFQEQCKDLNVQDPKLGYWPVGRVCVKVFDSPTEAYVKMWASDGTLLKNGRFPLGEDGQKFEGYFPGLATRSFYLYVILEPNNNYVAWKFLDLCTPENPNCNDNKQPIRLINFRDPNEPLDDVRPPPIKEPEQYQVSVHFTDIRVDNAHESTGGGDGEYRLGAYVQDLPLIDLTALSQWKTPGIGALNDVADGQALEFDPGNIYTFQTDSTNALTILTVGYESDGCASGLIGLFPNSIGDSIKASRTYGSAAAGAAVGEYYGGPAGAQAGMVVGPILDGIAQGIEKNIESKILCFLNGDDSIGTVIAAYDPPSYGAGHQCVTSDAKDYELCFDIAVQKIG